MNGAPPGPRFTNLADVAVARADELGGKPAYHFLEDGDERVSTLTYVDLDQRAGAMAAHLQAVARPSERFILALPPGPDYIVSFWACLYASVWAVPLYPPTNPKYIARMLSVIRHSGASGIITLSPIADALRRWLADQGIPADSLRWITTDALPACARSDYRRPALEPKGVAFLQYTSGSTGEPKGVMVSHENLMANSAILCDAYRSVHATAGCDREVLNAGWLPPYHDAGLIDGILQTVYAGKTSVLMSPLAFLEKPVRWLRAISRYRATAGVAPSFGYEYCTKRITDEEAHGLDLSSWVCTVNGTEPVRRDVVEQFVARFAPYGYDGRSLTPAYGLAEATLLNVVEARFGKFFWLDVDREKLKLNVIAKPEPGAASSSLVSLGKPAGDTRLLIVDPVTRVPCEADQVGEVWLAGTTVALGYWENPEATERVFGAYTLHPDGTEAEGPFLRSGDLGFVTSDGTFFFTGRLKDVIRVRCMNHYPHEIEVTTSASHPAFRSGGAAAFMVQHDDGDSFVVLQEVRPGLPDAELLAALSAAREAIVKTHGVAPLDIVLVEPRSVPKTSSGKTERFKAREQYLAGAVRKVRSLVDAAPANPGQSPEEQKLRRKIERSMVAWIAEHADLDIQAVDKQATFESFGIDSVRVVEMLSTVEAAIGAKVPDGAVFEHTSVAALAAFLASHVLHPRRDAAAGEAAGEAGDRPVGFVVPQL